MHKIKISSNSIDSNGVLFPEFSKGSSKSPHLQWDKVPGALSYAVIMMDRDATAVVGGVFIHWVVGNVETNFLDINASIENKTLLQFENSTTKKGYGSIIPEMFQNDVANVYFGPYPPNKDHLYEITVLALSEKDPFSHLDKSKHLLFPDFEKSVANKIIGTGTLYVVGLHVDEQGNLQSAKINNKFFKSGDFEFIKNIKVDNSNETLSKAYLSTINPETGKYQRNNGFKSPEITFDKVENAKSYVILVANSTHIRHWGLPIVNWGVYGISQQQSKIIKIEKNITQTNKIHEVLNSYSKNIIFPILPADILNASEDISYGFSLVEENNIQSQDGFYNFVVYATDLDPEEYGILHTQAEIINKINGHVIAQGNIKLVLSN